MAGGEIFAGSFVDCLLKTHHLTDVHILFRYKMSNLASLSDNEVLFEVNK